MVSMRVDLREKFGTRKVSVPCETVRPAGSAAEGTSMDMLHVDCDTCVARGIACSDCVVTVLLGASGGAVDLDPDEQAALKALAGSGLCRRSGSIPAPDRSGTSRRRWTGGITRNDLLTKYRRS